MFRQAMQLLPLVALIVTGTLGASDAAAREYFELKDGELVRPEGYREWIYVGTPVTPNDMNNGQAAFPEHHNVYMDPDSWEHWKTKGEFRDGTILVKELVSVGTKASASGNGYFQGEFIGLEATIKSRKHFADEPGNWAYFSFSTPDRERLTKSAVAFPTAACNACHQGAAAQDFVFTQHYPVLRGAKGRRRAGVGGVDDRLSATSSMGAN